jgi:hypothetical protein
MIALAQKIGRGLNRGKSTVGWHGRVIWEWEDWGTVRIV